MDSSSPSKRRKTSPITAIIVDASNTPTLIPSRDNEATTPSRASYLSPTKASLARFHPGLLPQLRQSEDGGTKAIVGSRRNPTFGRPRSAHGEGTLVNGITGLPRPTTPARRDGGDVENTNMPLAHNGAGTPSPRRTVQALRGGMSAAPRRRSRTPGRASPAATYVKPVTEPFIAASPPETPSEIQDGAQQIIDGQLEHELQGSAQRRSARLSQAKDRLDISASIDRGEPELPPTPTQLGLEAPPEPPKGLWNSPSRRPPRKKASGPKSSPLKPRDLAPEVPLDTPRRSSTRIQKRTIQPEREPEGNVKELSMEFLRKSRLRDELRVQLQKLQEDVALCENEVERIRKPNVLPAPDEETVSQLTSVLTNDQQTLSKPPPPKPPPLSHLLSSFLPFSKRPTPQLSALPTVILTDAPLPSCAPVDLEDPQPYLKVFTSLEYTSTTTLLSTADDMNDVLQRHEIIVTAPQHLLTLKLSLTVNASTQIATDLVVQSLSSWAEAELGLWIRDRTKEDVLASKDISGICWATSRYWILCEKRAQCWALCHEEFPGLLCSEPSTNGADDRTREDDAPNKRAGKRRKGKADALPLQNPTRPSIDDENNSDLVLLPRHIMLQHLGRPSLHFRHPFQKHLSLLLTWRITFDWTGEVASHLSAVSAVPAAWSEADDRGSLAKVGRVFEELVQKMGVMEAVRGVVGLLFDGVV